MKLIICDKCGETIRESWYIKRIISLSRYVQSERRYMDLDLCPSCRLELVRWLGNYDIFDMNEVDCNTVEDLLEFEERIYESLE